MTQLEVAQADVLDAVLAAAGAGVLRGDEHVHVGVLPGADGDTEFTSTRLAWERLPPGLQAKLTNAVATHSYANSRDQIHPDLATEIEWAKNRRLGPDRYAALDGREGPIPADLLVRVYREYEQRKQREGLMDFEDLLELTVQLYEQAGQVHFPFLGQQPLIEEKKETKTAWKNRLKAHAATLYPDCSVTLHTSDALLIHSAAVRGLLF